MLKEQEICKNMNNNFIISVTNIQETMSYINSKVSIIYFTEKFKQHDIKILEENKLIDNIFIISKNYNKLKSNKLIFETSVNDNLIKRVTDNTILLVDMNNNYEYIKYIAKNINKLFEISKKYNNKFGYKNDSRIMFVSIVHNNSLYLGDLINVFKVIDMPTQREKYEFIYDNACDFLDSKFYCNNLCDFHNDRCIASRAGETSHETMGCCYSFEYAGIFDFRMVKNVKVCKHLQNRKCATKNMACKLFTCRYLKKKNICFDSHKILLLECFFNKKQHEIIKSNFFRTREEILDKLLEKNNNTYLWYYMFKKYMIKTKD